MRAQGALRMIAIASLMVLAECGAAPAETSKLQGSPEGALVAAMETAAADTPGVSPAGNSSPGIQLPDNYRGTFEFLGSWAIAADDGKGSKQIHVVYASPGSIAAYEKDGHFPNGAVLVKEVFETATAEMTTGTVSRAQTLKGWFVMTRDSKNTHPGNKLWGDGWGWSWFDAADRTKTTTVDFRAECQPCHIPARATDWIYVQGYPPLKK
jgi:hypothetical protein